MEVQACDGSSVAFVSQPDVRACSGAGTLISMAGVDGAFFGTDEERRWVSRWEAHAERRQIFRLAGRGCGEDEIVLGLG